VAWTRLWSRLTSLADQVNLRLLRLDVNAPSLHEGYHARWGRHAEDCEYSRQWRAEIPLTAHGIGVGKLEVAGPHDAEPVWRKILTVTAVLDEFSLELSTEAPHLAVAAREHRKPRLAAETRMTPAASPYVSSDTRNVL
jgi:UDP-GlcNAc:undecaprenyl-phosphate/decaprenyl-phosphate GlcNAc-1-phosphate transferase